MLAPVELSRLIQDLDDADGRNVRAALATVVSVAGSTYRRPGARMLVRDDNVVAGGVSGGCVEADVVRKARAAMSEGRPVWVHYDATDDEDGGFGAGLGCQGEVDILIEPVWLKRTALHIACLREMLAVREPRVLALRFRGATRTIGAMAFFSSTGANIAGDPDAYLLGIDEPVLSVLRQRRWQNLTCEPTHPLHGVLLEYLSPMPRLFVVGAGPDSEPLASCGQALGYCVTVADERPGYLSRRRFPPGTRISRANLEHLVTAEVDEHTACVIATHNVSYDAKALAQLLPSGARYIGVLGPRKRTAWILQQVQVGQLGATSERLYAPTGLDIGADTPEQIALAVLAEIQAAMAGRSGGFLRDRVAPIHDDVLEPSGAARVRH